MLNLASAAKALKAISEDGEALRCVEHAPAEERRAVLKDIRKLAGPICMSFMMGEMEWPRKKQGVIMDAVMASRITLVASMSHSFSGSSICAKIRKTSLLRDLLPKSKALKS